MIFSEHKPIILIVDDEPINIEILATLLQQDYHIKVANNGAMALSIAENLPQPDLILLDIMMPEMNGYDVCQQLKANSATRDIPVIFITAMSDTTAESKGLQLGAVDYITKPINRDITRLRVNNYMAFVKSQKNLLEHETFLSALIKNSQHAIWAISNHDSWLLLNSLALDFMGYDNLQHANEQPVFDRFDQHRDLYIEHHQRALQGDIITFELEISSFKGKRRWLEITLSPQFDAYQRGIASIALATDISERKNIELDLRIAAIAFESQDTMLITDNAGIIVRVNKAFTESTGYSAEESVGQKTSLLKSGRHDADFYAAMWADIMILGSWHGEIWDRRKNGEVYPVWLSITAVKSSDGNIHTHYICTHTDITERKLVEEQVKQLAFYDPLTQLPNRRMLQERFKYISGINRRKNKEQSLALMMLDLDRFKSVNDSFGHLAGDELLKQVAERITARLREVDMVARLGGDEFVVLLENITHPEDAAFVAKDIIADLSQLFNLTQSNDVQIGASIGISLYPQHGDSLDILMDRADTALYKAKDSGRGCFAYFSEDMTQIARARMDMEIRLRKGIEQQELRVFYQPQVDIISGRIVGAEALVRWQDPVNGLIQPVQFIGIAEETGLIVDIGAWVLYQVCHQGKQWLDAGLPALTLAGNVSPYQFRHSDINQVMANALADSGFPPNQLELEITETGLMTNTSETIKTLNLLRAQGVRLAIDDFGTGFSSLGYLKMFPLDVLKIDKSFIDGIPLQQDAMKITAAIISMAHILDFKVLAEGVETAEQLAFLQEHNCDLYQGYIKSKPVTAPEFAELLRQQ